MLRAAFSPRGASCATTRAPAARATASLAGSGPSRTTTTSSAWASTERSATARYDGRPRVGMTTVARTATAENTKGSRRRPGPSGDITWMVEPLARTPGDESGLGGRQPGHRTARGGLEASLRSVPALVLFLHNRYRTTGGEERVVDDLLWLVRECLGEDAELLARDSAALGRARAATALLGGGL